MSSKLILSNLQHPAHGLVPSLPVIEWTHSPRSALTKNQPPLFRFAITDSGGLTMMVRLSRQKRRVRRSQLQKTDPQKQQNGKPRAPPRVPKAHAQGGQKADAQGPRHFQTAPEQTRRTDRNVSLRSGRPNEPWRADPVRGRGAAGSLLAEAVFAHLPNGGDPLIRGQSCRQYVPTKESARRNELMPGF